MAVLSTVLRLQYEIVAKLGYGGYSTIWLDSNLQMKKRYVAVNVLMGDVGESSACESKVLSSRRDVPFRMGKRDRAGAVGRVLGHCSQLEAYVYCY